MTPEKQALLDALTVERQHSPWWRTPEPPADDEVTQARRRRVLAEAYAESFEEGENAHG